MVRKTQEGREWIMHVGTGGIYIFNGLTKFKGPSEGVRYIGHILDVFLTLGRHPHIYCKNYSVPYEGRQLG